MDKKDKYIYYLENIIASLPGYVYWVDRNNVYLGCNDLQAHFLKLASRKEIVGKITSDFVSEKTAADRIDETNKKVMDLGELCIIEESGILPRGEFICLSQKAPIRDEHNEVVGMLGVSFDITDRKKMEKDLHEAKEQAEIANRVKEEFIRNIEHDIRTPVAGIIGISKYLQSFELDATKKNLLEDIGHASEALISYFNEVLEFSHLQSGGVPILFKKFNLRDLIKTVCQIEMPAAKNKHIELIQDYDLDIPSVFIGDKYRIQRILINLISNALKFTQAGYVKIKIELAEKIDPRNIVLKIIIEDTGYGISEEKQNVLYEKFSRGEPANKNIHKGSGLGLYIVRLFVNELNGEIEVKSAAGKGTSFIIYLPFRLPFFQAV